MEHIRRFVILPALALRVISLQALVPARTGTLFARSCPHLAKPHLAKTAFGKKIRIWPVCFRDRIWPNRIWPELVFQSVDRIWPNRIWPILVF